MKKLILSGIVGGLIVFAWEMISWMVMPWHGSTMENFKSPAVVQEILVANADKNGVYLIPACPKKDGSKATKDEMAKSHEQMSKGPFALVVMSPQGIGSMNGLMAKGLGIQILSALLITGLLLRTKIKSYFSRVGFVVTVALVAVTLVVLPNWNWWGFPLPFTLVGTADILIGWLLAGLAIAKISD